MAFYKRSVFLINPAFQLKFSLIVCSVILVSTFVYPFIIYDFFNLVIANVPNPPDIIVDAQTNLITYLVLIQVVILALVFIAFIFITHKIAGPLFKLKNHLAAIREGKEISPLVFREGDHFQDVAEEVTLFLETIEQNQESDFQYVDEVSQYIENLSSVIPDDKKPVLNEISRRLLDIKSRYKKGL